MQLTGPQISLPRLSVCSLHSSLTLSLAQYSAGPSSPPAGLSKLVVRACQLFYTHCPRNPVVHHISRALISLQARTSQAGRREEGGGCSGLAQRAS